MKNVLRIILLLVVGLIGLLTKDKLGGDENATQPSEQGTELATGGEQIRVPSGNSGGEIDAPRRLDPGKEAPKADPPKADPKPEPEPEPAEEEFRGVDRRGESAIMNAYNAKRSDVQINFTGRVKFTLPYDDIPPRHQNWVMELSNGHTVKISHNTDLAPKVPGLDKGDTVTVFGEYEYTAKGGVIHWTHHDPAKRHIGGYIRYKGKKYE